MSEIETPDFRIPNPRSVFQRELEERNVTPVFVKESSPEFGKMREQLNTRSGIAIANHPSNLDVPLVGVAVERTDFKIVSGRKGAPLLAEAIGNDHVISLDRRTPLALKKSFEEIFQQIDNGGLVIMYPTGGQRKHKPNQHNEYFQSGIRFILKNIKSESMVYSFYIDPTNIDNLGENESVKIDENITDAAEWQEIIDKNSKNPEQLKVLTENYLTKFNLDHFIFPNK
ncbi:MAG: 1-acyl-sn-glycerol-3-phosphate acyltransferase [Candidatus Doudnabacteria bacterium]|nr:1-acyl-sn-glycerol-3-phosphate acyltransferase [Candidatus Doudnabacteria bacterium]